jgi:hypothetical protein
LSGSSFSRSHTSAHGRCSGLWICPCLSAASRAELVAGGGGKLAAEGLQRCLGGLKLGLAGAG